MTGKQKTKLAMYESVITHCDMNSSTITAIPVFETVLNELKELISTIHSKASEEQHNIKGLAVLKSAHRQQLIHAGLNLAGSVFVYATTINDEDLKRQFKLNYSELNRLKDASLGPACEFIIRTVIDLKNELTPFGISDANICAAQTALSEYEGSVMAPRNAINDRVAVSGSIKELFKSADQVLKDRMDRLAVQFNNIDVTFYETYKRTRSIKNTGWIDPRTALNHA